MARAVSSYRNSERGRASEARSRKERGRDMETLYPVRAGETKANYAGEGGG